MAGKKAHENFSQGEKDQLLEYVKQHLAVLESKKTDSYTNKKKVQVWQEIANKFNSHSNCQRTVTQLKGVWKRMKIRAKKDVSAHQKARKVTGGGAEVPPVDVSSQVIAEMLPGDFKVPENPYDDDADEQDEGEGDQHSSQPALSPAPDNEDEPAQKRPARQSTSAASSKDVAASTPEPAEPGPSRTTGRKRQSGYDIFTQDLIM